MLSADRRAEIRRQAVVRARALDDQALIHESFRLTVAHANAEAGDERDALEIESDVHALENGTRNLRQEKVS